MKLIKQLRLSISLFTGFLGLLPQVTDAQKVDYQIQVVTRTHDFERYNAITQEETSPLSPNSGVLHAHGNAQWEVKLTPKNVKDRPDATQYKLVAKLVRGEHPKGNIGVQLVFKDWSAANYVLMPGAVYNGNRYDWRRIAYSPKLLDPRDISPDKPTIITDVPKLDIGNGYSRIEERIGGMTSPSIGFYSPSKAAYFWLLTEQMGYRGLDQSMAIEETRQRNQATITLTSTTVRQYYKYRITDNRYPVDDVPLDYNQGDSVVINFTLYTGTSNTLQGLFDRFLTIRKDMSGPMVYLPALGFSSTFPVQEKKYNSFNWVPGFNYYAIGPRDNFLQDWQIGWTGGLINTIPLYGLGADSTKQRVVKQLDWLYPNGIAPSGYYWDSGEKGDKWYGGDIRKPHTANWHLIRKSADGIYFALKLFKLMQADKVALKPTWTEGNRQVVDAMVKTWNKHKQLGQFVDSRTGDVVVGGSASGGLAPAALALAARFYKQPAYLSVAKELMAYYHDKYIKAGLTTGGPGDAMQNPDSESAFALLESAVVLYEETKEPQYLNMAQVLAAQFATWVQAYNYQFPKTSMFGANGIKATGAVFANAQNKHGAPGICTHSGDVLLRLYLYTKNDQYLNLLKDIVFHLPQYMGHPDRPLVHPFTKRKVGEGWVCERVSTTDWLEGIGEITYQSTWAEISLMLTTLEVPALFASADLKTVKVLDHLEVVSESWSAKGVKLKVKNPTKFAMKVRMAWYAKGSQIPQWQTVTIAAGAVSAVTLASR